MASGTEIEHCPEGPSFHAQRFAAQFVIWATRIWVAAVKRRESPLPVLDQAFAAAGAASASPHLHGLLRTVAAAATRSIDIRCPSCSYLSGDEATLVRTIGAFQRDALGEAAMLLTDWLPPAAVRLAVGQAQAMALALADADLDVATAHPPSDHDALPEIAARLH